MDSNATAAHKETEARLRRALWSCEDVRKVVKLVPLPSGRWRYLIETPFQFPKFVIATVDADANNVRVEVSCGAEWSALHHWDNPPKEEGAMTAESASPAEPVCSLTP